MGRLVRWERVQLIEEARSGCSRIQVGDRGRVVAPQSRFGLIQVTMDNGETWHLTEEALESEPKEKRPPGIRPDGPRTTGLGGRGGLCVPLKSEK